MTIALHKMVVPRSSYCQWTEEDEVEVRRRNSGSPGLYRPLCSEGKQTNRADCKAFLWIPLAPRLQSGFLFSFLTVFNPLAMYTAWSLLPTKLPYHTCSHFFPYLRVSCQLVETKEIKPVLLEQLASFYEDELRKIFPSSGIYEESLCSESLASLDMLLANTPFMTESATTLVSTVIRCLGFAQ